MNLAAILEKALLAEYERRLDDDATARLIDRVQAVERDVADLKNARNNAAGMLADSRARAI